MRYDIQPDGTVVNRREFLDVENNDGMKPDRDRATGNRRQGPAQGEVRISSAAGKRLGTIQLPDIPRDPRKQQVCATNVGFGDPDGKGLYITSCNLALPRPPEHGGCPPRADAVERRGDGLTDNPRTVVKLQPGTRLGPYEVLSALGAGGMGEVYRARDTRLDRIVALKVLPARLAAEPDRQRRFEGEARAIASLNHPHICQIYDIGPGYLVLEYCRGHVAAGSAGTGGSGAAWPPVPERGESAKRSPARSAPIATCLGNRWPRVYWRPA